VSAAALGRLEHEIDLRRVRAPVKGRLGDVATLRVGAVVKEGDKLGAVIPTGDIRIVADYTPGSAVGRIRPGQSARMHPEGFPWTQYGSLRATVERVANEPRSGRIRVELVVARDPGGAIPLQHGLPGTLEIEVDRVSPAVLVLRSAGGRFSAPASAHEPSRSGGAAVRDETLSHP
jgi:membrane fusion protein (multidrug efflux system)